MRPECGRVGNPVQLKSLKRCARNGIDTFPNTTFTLDTNTIIYYLKGDAKVVKLLDKLIGNDTPLYVSAITEVELLSFKNLTDNDILGIEDLLNSLAVMALDPRLAKTAGYVRRAYGLSLPDSVIAATALFTGSTLLTRNVKDFKPVPNLSINKT